MTYEYKRLQTDEGVAWFRLQNLEDTLGMDAPETKKARSYWADLAKKLYPDI